MARLEIRPFSDEFLARRRAARGSPPRAATAEPLLPERYEDAAAAQAEVEALWRSTAPRVPSRFATAASSATCSARAARPDLGRPRLGRARRPRRRGAGGRTRPLRRRGRALGRRGRALRHYALVPAPDAALLDAWSRVGFGQQHAHGIREVPEGEWPEGVRLADGARRRRARRPRPRCSPTTRRTRPSSRAACATTTRRGAPRRDPRGPRQGGDRRPRRRARRPDRRLVPLVPAEQSSVHSGLARPTAPPCSAGRRRVRTCAAPGAGLALTEAAFAWARERGHETMVTDWRVTNLLASRFWPHAASGRRSSGCTGTSRSAADPDPVGLAHRGRQRAGGRARAAAPGPVEPIADVAAAVRDALRFPLSGPPLEALVTAGGKATIVVEAPELPLPGARRRPAPSPRSRRRSRSSSGSACRRGSRRSSSPAGSTGAPASASSRRCCRRLRAAVPRPRRGARRRGARPRPRSPTPDARRCGSTRSLARDRSRRLRHGRRDRAARRRPGAARGVRRRRRCARRRPTRCSRPPRSRGWQLGLALERALAARVPVIGASLVLNPPRLTGRFRGYPYEDASLEQLARSPLRRFSLLPAGVAPPHPRRISGASSPPSPPSPGRPRSRTPKPSCAGSPARCDAGSSEPLDAIVIGMPWKHHTRRGSG